MDSTDNETGYLTEENKIVGDKNDRNWDNRLRLRKAAVQPPAMQSRDKHGSKKMIANQEQRTEQTRPVKTQQSRHVVNVPGDILSFRCSECKDKREFSPNDLLRHFQEKHRGSTPFFSCDMCTFNTHKVSCLQVHILGHKDTFASCIICNDNVKRTLLELTAHLDVHHRVNGFYSCERCKFSVSDVGAFVEHMHLHGLTLCDKGSHSGCTDVQSHREPIPKATQLPFCCPLCDYEAPLKDIIAKHMVTVHGDERCHIAKRRVKTIRHKLDDSSPRLRWRGSMAKEMHWMSQDCLSVPGREFLERYCNLSGSEKALEEAQHLLERSVAAETGGESWTKALQSVLSNVPQDIAHFSVLESGTTTNPVLPNTGNNLTVLTVKNKISVPQNGSAEAIGLKMVEGRRNMVSKVMPPGKPSLTISSETCPEDSHCAADTQRCQSNLNISPQTQPTSHPGSLLLGNNIATTSLQNEFAGCNQSQENGENQRMRSVQEDHGQQARQCEVSQNANHCEDEGGFIELKLRKERSENEEKSPLETRPCSKNKKRRKAFRPKIVNKPSPGLKLFLKKDPVKERQWTSQCPFPVIGGGFLEDYQSLPHPQRTLEETQLFLQRALSEENGVKKWTKATKIDQQNVPKATTPSSQSKPKEGPIPNLGHLSSIVSGLMAQNKTSAPPACTTNVMNFKMAHGKGRLVVSSEQETHDETEEALFSMETEVDDTTSERCTGNLSSTEDKGLTNSDFPPGALINSDSQSPFENIPLQNTSFSPENMREVYQVEKDGAYSNMEGTTQAQVVTMPVTPMLQFLSLPQGMTNLSRDPRHTTHVSTQQQNEHKVTGKKRREASSDNCPDPLSKADNPSSPAMVQEARRVSVCRWEPAPKHVERTLKLLPATPTQLVKCPDGDQPVVVLNHPDADIPEVTNIMDVVHRYKGDVQKVVLSQTTLNALSAIDGETVGGSEPTKPHGASQQPGWPENLVKERFVLKLKLKKTSGKKYKVVDVVSHCSGPPVRYTCWFCGRVFSTREMWISHGQRHLVAWKRQNCET